MRERGVKGKGREERGQEEKKHRGGQKKTWVVYRSNAEDMSEYYSLRKKGKK